ncbi:hypothetical protein ACBI99_14320 [Nonomuraea sp. ATR24]|uniref:hypothetical protein n=1 Tax=Nonomuraea sp. ATR24 TaxID=1676744 RepID=UPI0035BFBDC3
MTEPAYLSSTRQAYDTVAADYAELLTGSGLVLDVRLIREPDDTEKPRSGPQAFFLAHRRP